MRAFCAKNESRTFTFAAMDTTSSALAQTLQLLSEYPEVQEKLRQEVIQASGGDIETDIQYDELVDLPYLDAVCRETLRMYVLAYSESSMPLIFYFPGIRLCHSYSESKLFFSSMDGP